MKVPPPFPFFPELKRAGVRIKGNRVGITGCRATVSSQGFVQKVIGVYLRRRTKGTSQETCLYGVGQCFRVKSDCHEVPVYARVPLFPYLLVSKCCPDPVCGGFADKFLG